MPSTNRPSPPPTGADPKTGASRAHPVNPLHALLGALILASLGTAALAIDIFGFWLALMWLLYAAAVVVSVSAATIWAATPRRKPLAAHRAGHHDHYDARDGFHE